MTPAVLLLGCVTVERLGELWLAGRNTRTLLANGAREMSPGHYPLTVGLHALWAREFVVEVPDDVPLLSGDPFLFEQMLMQVVDNAWKYSKPDSRIELSAAQSGTDVIVSVRNQGIEIPVEERTEIFGKFYRGAANRAQVEGTGLGLAIARTIAEAHGGSLWLDSDAEGPTFRFRLPAGRSGETNDSEQNGFAHR